MKALKTPGDLKKTGKNFWKKVLSEYELTETHDLERLKMAARCLDNLFEAEERVKVDGMFITNRYGSTVEHPGMKTVKDMRLLFVKIIRELGLDLAVSDSRPPGRY
jgi:P27 family predicted phage terminase small subunit